MAVGIGVKERVQLQESDYSLRLVEAENGDNNGQTLPDGEVSQQVAHWEKQDEYARKAQEVAARTLAQLTMPKSAQLELF